MDDDVAGVDENPVATLETFDPYIPCSLLHAEPAGDDRQPPSHGDANGPARAIAANVDR